MMNIYYTNKYRLASKILVKENPSLVEEIITSINLFRKNPDDTRLQNHRLHKGMKGKLAFSVDDDIRIVYEWVGKKTVRFLTIGTHKQVYRVKSSSK